VEGRTHVLLWERQARRAGCGGATHAAILRGGGRKSMAETEGEEKRGKSSSALPFVGRGSQSVITDPVMFSSLKT
jgi:hypothetical protein